MITNSITWLNDKTLYMMLNFLIFLCMTSWYTTKWPIKKEILCNKKVTKIQCCLCNLYDTLYVFYNAFRIIIKLCMEPIYFLTVFGTLFVNFRKNISRKSWFLSKIKVYQYFYNHFVYLIIFLPNKNIIIHISCTPF